MDHFTKLWHSIVDSTIWDADDQTRIVWITMLAKVDQDGNVYAAIPGLAHAARVSLPDCERALEFLKKPDQYSRSKEYDGRRIEDIPGGWRILNHQYYSHLQGTSSAAARMRRYRERQRNGDVTQRNGDVTQRNGDVTQRNGDVTQRNGDVTQRNALPDLDLDLDPTVRDPHTNKTNLVHPLLTQCPNKAARTPPRARKTKPEYSDDFLSFMEEYPRKEDKRRAFVEWERLRKAGKLPSLSILLASLHEHKQGRQWQEGVIPHARTFLHNERWNDVIPPWRRPETKNEMAVQHQLRRNLSVLQSALQIGEGENHDEKKSDE
jgi:hypothetical protein